MYDDNAWPQAAAIDAFIPQRKRPPQVTVAVFGFLAAAGLTLLTGALYTTPSTAASGFVLTLPFLLALGVAILVAIWCSVLAKAAWSGRKWVVGPARWTAVGLMVACGGFGAMANPQMTAMSSPGYGWFYALLVLGSAAAGAVVLVCLLGRQVSEYFDPPAQPSPFQHQQGLPPMTGNEADWTPPRQAGPGGAGGQQRPPFGL